MIYVLHYYYVISVLSLLTHHLQAWALQRGYLTAKASRPDIYRAANSILRLAVTGKLNIFTIPLGYAETCQGLYTFHLNT